MPIRLVINAIRLPDIHAHQRHGLVAEREGDAAVHGGGESEHLQQINLGRVIRSRLQVQPEDVCTLRKADRNYRVQCPDPQEWHPSGEWLEFPSSRPLTMARS